MTISRRPLLLLPALAAAAALFAACAPEEKSGIEITGTLDSASGASAPLTLDVNVLGTGFNMSATLDGEVVTGAGPWGCFGPLEPDYPNYDLEASDDQTFGFFLSIDPMAWSTGAHAIDGDLIHLLIAAPDRYGVATSGTVYITKAGTTPGTPGHDCGVLITGPITLEGEKDR